LRSASVPHDPVQSRHTAVTGPEGIKVIRLEDGRRALSPIEEPTYVQFDFENFCAPCDLAVVKAAKSSNVKLTSQRALVDVMVSAESASNKDAKWEAAVVQQCKRCHNLWRVYNASKSIYPKGFPVPWDTDDGKSFRSKLQEKRQKPLPKQAVETFLNRLVKLLERSAD
jgi:hypothetical protein